MHQHPSLFHIIGDQGAVQAGPEKKIEDSKLVPEDGPQVGLEMNGHEVGEAFRPVHGDAQTFAHGAARPVTGDDIAATDLQHLAGGAILK